MSTQVIKVYHCCPPSAVHNIARNGYFVQRTGVNIYGRGAYFWESYADAQAYLPSTQSKHSSFAGDFQIVSTEIAIRTGCFRIYDAECEQICTESGPDYLSSWLMRQGIEVIIIPNYWIANTTLSNAKGKAYVLLVNLQ